jgi:hypothetical protein
VGLTDLMGLSAESSGLRINASLSYIFFLGEPERTAFLLLEATNLPILHQSDL